jgi:guanylate kinase
MNHKRVILVGPTGSGKDFIKNKFREKGYKVDVSYTTRAPREGEVNGVDYNFITEKQFKVRLDYEFMYECISYGKDYYGTGMAEWNNCDVFIMETDGVGHIEPKDRKDCLIIYVNTPLDIRMKRMKERGWDHSKILERIKIDEGKFKDFKDYDLQVSSVTQNEF